MSVILLCVDQMRMEFFHIVSPLTKEMISTKNHRGRNYGGEGTIKSVDKDGKVLEVGEDSEEEQGEEETDDEEDHHHLAPKKT